MLYDSVGNKVLIFKFYMNHLIRFYVSTSHVALKLSNNLNFLLSLCLCRHQPLGQPSMAAVVRMVQTVKPVFVLQCNGGTVGDQQFSKCCSSSSCRFLQQSSSRWFNQTCIRINTRLKYGEKIKKRCKYKFMNKTVENQN